MNLKNFIAEYLKDSASKIENNECSLSEDEMSYLFSQIAHQELNKTQAADLLNLNVRTFDRKIQAGELPEGKHIRGSKSLVWYKDELIKD